MKAIFLSHQNALTPGGGGQQLCTREYRELLREAGFELTDMTFDTDRSLRARLRRRLKLAPYANLVPETFVSDVAAAASKGKPEFVFCNLYNLMPYGRRLKTQLPRGTKLVLLSHGLASVDEVHAARIIRHGVSGAHLPQISDAWIGQMMRAECEGLPAFDHVFCLAAFEVEICRWLGARSVSWLPRLLRPGGFIDRKPSGDRVGIVGTMDHPPNLEGVELFCAALKAVGPRQLRLRVVTHSHAIATDLAARYAFVDYLGPMLAPGAIEAEVTTWSAFVHPIFCHAMGCSTKVATALNWGLPVLTTVAGLRGYAWKSGELPLSESPADLALVSIAVLDPGRSAALSEQVRTIVQSSSTLGELAGQLRADLGIT